MEAVILGLIQGLTEFLPISSSGHLILIPYLLGWAPSGLAFDVALNTGTFAAVLIYFFPVWWGLLTRGLIGRQKKELNLFWALVIASIPAGLIGYFAKDAIELFVRQPAVAAIMLITFGLLLWWAEKTASLSRSLNAITLLDGLKIGLAQALALIPGVSRSGVTMTAGLRLGLTKEDAAQFSFLLIAPVSFGAALLELDSVIQAPNTTEMALGAFVSFIVGLIAIHFLLKFVKKYGFVPYVWYRLIVGLVFLGLIFYRG